MKNTYTRSHLFDYSAVLSGEGRALCGFLNEAEGPLYNEDARRCQRCAKLDARRRERQ